MCACTGITGTSGTAGSARAAGRIAAVAARTDGVPAKRFGPVETRAQRHRSRRRPEIAGGQHRGRCRRPEIRGHCQFDLRDETGLGADQEASRHTRKPRHDVQGSVLRAPAVQRR